MKKKTSDKKADLKHMLYSNSPYISHEFPNIKSIGVTIKFTDSDDGREFTKTITYQPNSKAYFQYDCPYRECSDGGYDLKNVIEKAINSSDRQAQEKLKCNGWQDAERVGKHHCLLEALVEVEIDS